MTARTATLAAIAAIAIPLADASGQRLANAHASATRGQAPAAVFGNSWKYFGEERHRGFDALVDSRFSIVPGTGQAWLGRDRFVAYLAVEAYAWARYAADAREGRQARAIIGTSRARLRGDRSASTRPVGDFDYYEPDGAFRGSGAFDAIPGVALDPEPDHNCQRSHHWLLAQTNLLVQPFGPAISSSNSTSSPRFIEEGDWSQYRWSWNNAQLECAEFRRTIRRSNNAYRNSLEGSRARHREPRIEHRRCVRTVPLRRQEDASGSCRTPPLAHFRSGATAEADFAHPHGVYR